MPQEISWEGKDSAEIGGGKFGHSSCAESLVHIQCVRLVAEQRSERPQEGSDE